MRLKSAVLCVTLGVLFAGGMVLSNVTVADAQSDNVSSDFVIATTNQALKSIKSAEASGADVSALIERFNMALDLQHQAEAKVYESCPNYNRCIAQSNTVMLSIVEDATVLGNEATASIEQASVLTFAVYVPAGAFALSVAVVMLHRAWSSRRAERYQKMDIHQKRGH
jgi:hypothetical protein